MNEAELQSLTPDEYVAWIDPKNQFSELERGYCRERFVLADLTRQVQTLLTDSGSIIGLLITKLDEVEQLNIKINEQGHIIDSVLAQPEEKDVH